MSALKVLIPTDFTIQSEFAYILIQKLAQRIPVEIHFLHVMNVPDTVFMDAQGKIQTCGDIDPSYVQSQKQMAERKLEALVTEYGPSVLTHVVLGKTTDAIIDYSVKFGFDLIAMGTKGSIGLREKLSGSETQQVARKSAIPVLSLMCDRSDLEINNLLLVHDFADPVEQDLSLMRTLIEAFNPKLHLLQIVREGSSDSTTLMDCMDSFAKRHQLTNIEKHVIRDTDVEQGVIHFNEMNNIDLICIGTHGRGGLLHSSATEKLINHMYKPIISFHLKG